MLLSADEKSEENKFQFCLTEFSQKKRKNLDCFINTTNVPNANISSEKKIENIIEEDDFKKECDEKISIKTKEIISNISKLKKKAKIKSNNLNVYLHSLGNEIKSKLGKESEEVKNISKKEVDKKIKSNNVSSQRKVSTNKEKTKKNNHESFYEKYKTFKNQSKSKYNSRNPKSLIRNGSNRPPIKHDIKIRYRSNNNKTPQNQPSIERDKVLKTEYNTNYARGTKQEILERDEQKNVSSEKSDYNMLMKLIESISSNINIRDRNSSNEPNRKPIRIGNKTEVNRIIAASQDKTNLQKPFIPDFKTQFQAIIKVLKNMKTNSDEMRKKQSEKKKILKEQTNQLKTIESRERNQIILIEELKFHYHLIYQEYIKQRLVFKDILNAIKEKDISINSKTNKEQLIKEIESINDFRENDLPNHYNCEEIIKFPKLKSYLSILSELGVKQEQLFSNINGIEFVDDICECKDLKVNHVCKDDKWNYKKILTNNPKLRNLIEILTRRLNQEIAIRSKLEESSFKVLINGLNKDQIIDGKIKESYGLNKKNFNFSMISSVKSNHDKEASNDSILEEIY